MLFGIGLTGLAPATVSTLTLAEPLTAGLLGVLVLGEALTAGGVVGLVVLAGGIVLLATGSRGGGGRRGSAGAEHAGARCGTRQPNCGPATATPVRDVGGAR